MMPKGKAQAAKDKRKNNISGQSNSTPTTDPENGMFNSFNEEDLFGTLPTHEQLKSNNDNNLLNRFNQNNLNKVKSRQTFTPRIQENQNPSAKKQPESYENQHNKREPNRIQPNAKRKPDLKNLKNPTPSPRIDSNSNSKNSEHQELIKPIKPATKSTHSKIPKVSNNFKNSRASNPSQNSTEFGSADQLSHEKDKRRTQSAQIPNKLEEAKLKLEDLIEANHKLKAENLNLKSKISTVFSQAEVVSRNSSHRDAGKFDSEDDIFIQMTQISQKLRELENENSYLKSKNNELRSMLGEE